MAAVSAKEKPPDDQVSKQSYSNVASTPIKTRWERFYLQKVLPGVTYSLQVEEIAKFVYKSLKIPPGKLISYDDSIFQQLLLEVNDEVPQSIFNTTSAIEIKDGLRARPRVTIFEKPSTFVRVYWTSVTTPDEDFESALGYFGEVLEIRHMKFRAGPRPTELERMMDGVRKGDRVVKMHLKKPIPSYGIIAGKKCKFIYDNQDRTCSRCHQYVGICQGDGIPKKCEEEGVPKMEIEKAWELAIKADDSIAIEQEDNLNKEFEFDYIEIFGVEVGTENDNIKEWLEENEFELDDMEELEPGENVRARKVMGLTLERARELIRKCHMKKMGDKSIKVQPINLRSPTKGKSSRAAIGISKSNVNSRSQIISDEKTIEKTINGNPSSQIGLSSGNLSISNPLQSTRVEDHTNNNLSIDSLSIIQRKNVVDGINFDSNQDDQVNSRRNRSERSKKKVTRVEKTLDEDDLTVESIDNTVVVPPPRRRNFKRKVAAAELSSPEATPVNKQHPSLKLSLIMSRRKWRVSGTGLKKKKIKKKLENVLDDISDLHDSDFEAQK